MAGHLYLALLFVSPTTSVENVPSAILRKEKEKRVF